MIWQMAEKRTPSGGQARKSLSRATVASGRVAALGRLDFPRSGMRVALFGSTELPDVRYRIEHQEGRAKFTIRTLVASLNISIEDLSKVLGTSTRTIERRASGD